MFIELLKAFAVGICASAPIGPAAILVMRRTLGRTQFAGFVAGLGAAVVDTLFAGLSMLAFSFVQDFVFARENWILVVGGIVVSVVGIILFNKRQGVDISGDDGGESHLRCAGEVALCSLANPGAFALMLALIALFRIDVNSASSSPMMLILCLCAGTVAWWFFFSSCVSIFRRAIKKNHLKWINRIAGIAVLLFGIVLIVKGIMMF